MLCRNHLNIFGGCTSPSSNQCLIARVVICICYYVQIAGDDYCEPWDAKPAHAMSADTSDYWDPCDKIPTAPTPARKSSKDDYIDPYDAKKDVPSQGGLVKVVKSRPKKPPPSREEDSGEESYDDPYDTGKVTLLDEQSNRLSIRGMRIPSVDGHQLTDRDEKRGRMSIDKYDESFLLHFSIYLNSFWVLCCNH